MVYNILFGVACALFVAIAILQLVLIFNLKEQWNKFLGVNLSVYLIWLALFFIGPIIGGSELGFFEALGEALSIIVFIIYFYIPLVVLSIILLIVGIVIKIKNNILSNKKLIFKIFATSLVSILLILLLATLVAQLF